jgi:hypothetical protein
MRCVRLRRNGERLHGRKGGGEDGRNPDVFQHSVLLATLQAIRDLLPVLPSSRPPFLL